MAESGPLSASAALDGDQQQPERMANEDKKERKHRDRKDKERRRRDGKEEDEEERRRRKKRHREKKRLREEAGVGKEDEEGEIVPSKLSEKEEMAEKDPKLEPGEIESFSKVSEKPGLAFKVTNGVTRVSSSSRVNIFEGLKEKTKESTPSGQERVRNGKTLIHDLDAPETGMQILLSTYGDSKEDSMKDDKRRSQGDLDRDQDERRQRERDRGEARKRHDPRDAVRRDDRARQPSMERSSRRTEDDSPDRKSIRSKSRESFRSRDRSLDRQPRSRSKDRALDRRPRSPSKDSARVRRKHRSRSRESAREPPPPPPRRRDLSIDRTHESSPARRGSREPSYRRGDRDRQADSRGPRDDYRSRRSESRSRREDSRAPSSRVDPEEELKRKVEEEQKRSVSPHQGPELVA
jgi:hypothetical protein